MANARFRRQIYNFLTPHILYVRTQDRAGNWSTLFSRNFIELS